MNKIVYYELVRRELPIQKGQIMTAAVWSCQLCGETISGMCGPGRRKEICVSCGEEIMDGDIKYIRKNDLYHDSKENFLKNLQAIHGKEEGLKQYNEIMERENGKNISN